MASVTPSTTAANTPEHSQSSNQASLHGGPRRRDKAQLSCTLCRRRKLRCDRNQPCSTCSTRGLSLSCTFVRSGSIAHGKPEQNRPPLASPTGIQNRINQLEGLVVSLMSTLHAKEQDGHDHSTVTHSLGNFRVTEESHRDRESFPTEVDHPDQICDTFGRISLENAETSYVGSGHWIAILDGIAELKDHFEDAGGQYASLADENADSQIEVPELLFGRNKYATKHEILGALPPKPIVDRLVSRYFNAMEMAPVVIHGPTFLKEYEIFWQNPIETPVMWLGLLFSMMCLAMQFQQFSGDAPVATYQFFQPPSKEQTCLQYYREKAVQCLVLGKYAKSAPYTVEALLLYFTTEHFRCEDTQIGTWVLMGIIVRIAMRMGYHRDPSHSSQISSFQGEMQRRAWAMIVQLDIITSSQIGLPRMIRAGQSDTAEPRNLLDDDFEEGMFDLPPSRSNNDSTPMLYCNVKSRILSVFGMISDLSASTQPFPYHQVMRLDRTLHEARLNIPLGLQLRSLAKSITDQSDLVMRRLFLDLLFHKARCILHRNFLLPAHACIDYVYSRQSCIDSSLQILQHQSTLNQETQAGGRLYRDRWKVSSLVNHDFLLAATILCLDLDHDLTTGLNQWNSESNERSQRDDVIRSLHESYRIFLQSSSSSREARRAAEALGIVLEKVARIKIEQNASSIDMFANKLIVDNQATVPSTALEPLFTSPNTTGLSDQATISTQSATTESPLTSIIDDEHSLSSVTNNFDWASWDSQLQAPELQDFMNGNDINDFGYSDWMQ